MTLTRKFHRKSYLAISPTLATTTVASRVVLIAGGSTGIGYHIALSFVRAGVAKLVLFSRRLAVLQDAVTKLNAARPSGSATVIIGMTADLSSTEDMDRLWTKLDADGIVVDTLVLNAFKHAPVQITTAPTEPVWSCFEFNVLNNLTMVRRFLDHGPSVGKVLIPLLQCFTYRTVSRLFHLCC